MSEEESHQARIQRLKERRIRVADERESKEKRGRLVNGVVAKVNDALKTQLFLGNFDPNLRLPFEIERKRDFRDFGGLVAAHVSEAEARSILLCCETRLGE